ncbi:MAG TPA: NAD(P)-dependent alcohol dehydrogenase, partial [Aliiroseovarius sp.]|nr:NAD(P)-dependent alcohol dehydrogenase [Aliiroseovarius sp.]
MKAATYTKYGGPDVVSISDLPVPKPGPNEVLIRVHASTVSAGDWRMRSLEVPRGLGLAIRAFAGWTRPRKPVLGGDAAGIIVDMGARVTGWSIGDAVVAYPGAAMGGHADYLMMPADGTMALKPAGLSHAEAAAIPFGGLTALEFLTDKGARQGGEKGLIVGASGGVGSAAVQLARHFGAGVTAVCSAANAALVTDLGAHRVVDYRTQDIATRPDRYDVILDTTGTAPWRRVRHLLTPRGRLLVVTGG